MPNTNQDLSQDSTLEDKYLSDYIKSVATSVPSSAPENFPQEARSSAGPDAAFSGGSNRVKVDKIADPNYTPLSLESMPSGALFYQNDMDIRIRSATVAEIENYSAVEMAAAKNPTLELINLMSSCTKVVFAKSAGSWRSISLADMMYVVLKIRDLTFINKKHLVSPYYDEATGTEGNIEICEQHFEYYSMPEALEPYYSVEEKCFVFETNFGKTIRMAPPTCGVLSSFAEYTRERSKAKRTPNLTFLKVAQFMYPGRDHVDAKEIESAERAFSNPALTSVEELSLVNHAAGLMEFGIKGLRKVVDGVEIRTELTFPDGPGAIFFIPDPFANLIKK